MPESRPAKHPGWRNERLVGDGVRASHGGSSVVRAPGQIILEVERSNRSPRTVKLVWHEKLGRADCPYIERWAIDFGLFSLRVHHWIRSDDLRSPHDHPSWFLTLVLAGSYDDVSYPLQTDGTPDLGARHVDRLRPGSVRFRRAHHVHSVAVSPGGCWTVLIFGKPVRRWGFWVARKAGAKFKKSNKYFLEHGHHPCDQP